MKTLSTLFILVLFYLSSLAQSPVLTAASFPVIGDSINAYVELLPNLIIKAAGENLNWDFSRLDGLPSVSTVFDDADNATSRSIYPDAELFVKVGNFERFYSSTSDKFVEIGNTSLDPITNSVFLTNRYTTPYVIRRAPMEYGDINRFETSIVSTFLFDDLPDTLKSQIPIKPDSIRVTVVLERYDTIDAWGNVTMPSGESFSALREKKTQVQSTKIETYLGFLGWTDATQQIKGFLPGLDVFDPRSTTSYTFVTEKQKQPLAVLTLDTLGEVADVQYQGANIVATKNTLYTKSKISVSPNPGYGKVQFTFSNFPHGQYDLKVFSILGNVHWETDLNINSSRVTLKKNLSYLSKGTYLFSVSDKSGNPISTKRLIILKP